jgi:hypothetical protein
MLLPFSLRSIVLGSLLSFLLQTSGTKEATFKATTYQGGESTPLRAILGIALADRIPLGIVFGPRQLLCGEQRDYNFKGLSPQEALLQTVHGTGYRLDTEDGILNLFAPDLTEHEGKVLSYQFRSFPNITDNMAFFGATLSGWISVSIDGGQGYGVSLMGSGNEEKLALPQQTDKTAIQIANAVVQMGSRGIWTLSPSEVIVKEVKQESSGISIYSFHDSEANIRNLTCPKNSLR